MCTQKISTPQPKLTPDYADMIAVIKEGRVVTAKRDREVAARALHRVALGVRSQPIKIWLIAESAQTLEPTELDEFTAWTNANYDMGYRDGIARALLDDRSARIFMRLLHKKEGEELI